MLGVSKPCVTGVCECHCISAVPGGHYTIEHIYARSNRTETVDRTTNAHKVARLVFGKKIGTWRKGLGHLLRSFANAKATQGISGKSQFNKSLGTKLPKGQIRAPLNNSKKQLVFPGLGFQASAGPIYAAHDRFF
jgi:hypothetical protein